MTTEMVRYPRQSIVPVSAPPAARPEQSPDELTTVGFPPSAWVVRTARPVNYDVRLVDDVLDPANPALVDAGATRPEARPRRLVVIDATVNTLYGDRLRAYLSAWQVEYRLCVLPVSEQSKTMESVFTVVRALDAFGISRRHEPIIGIGGGVLLDIVGLASSLYRRSTPYVRVPTTLIGLVDAGVGAKTGVNFGSHKNRLGTYFPAETALLDRAFLSTLDVRQLCNGLAEVLKIGLVKDRRLFDLLAEHGELLVTERLQGRTGAGDRAANEVLSRAIHGMLEELQPNLWEQQLERIVDYGHTFSPTIEMGALPSLLHGEAVAVDMALTTVLATARGLVTAAERDQVLRVMRALRLPVWHPLCEPQTLADALEDTVRHRDGLQRLPLPVGIGRACFVNDVRPDELAQAAQYLRMLAAGHA